MFNHRPLRITRRFMAITAVTIVTAFAARTTTAFAVAPVAQPAPWVVAPFAPAAPSTACVSLWSDPVHNTQTTSTPCTTPPTAPAHVPTSTRSVRPAAAA